MESNERRRGGLSAGWFGRGVPGGCTVVVVALLEHDIGFVLVGIATIALSAWLAMRRLADGPCLRSFLWVCVDAAVSGAVIGLYCAFGSRPMMYVLVAAAVLGGPWLATLITGEHELTP